MNRTAATSEGAPSWDIRTALLLIGVQTFGQAFFVFFAVPILTLVSGGPVADLTSDAGSIFAAVVGAAAYLFASATALELTRSLCYRRGWPSFAAAVALRPTRFTSLGVILAVTLAIGADGLSLILGKPIVPIEFRPIFANVLGGALFGLFLVLVPPVVEEVLFRGVLFPALARTYGRAFGIVASALLFGVVHSLTYGLDWYPILLATVTGLLLSALRAYSGSLWPSIAAHAAANSYAVLEALLLPGILGYWP